jgi:hypothetical protein
VLSPVAEPLFTHVPRFEQSHAHNGAWVTPSLVERTLILYLATSEYVTRPVATETSCKFVTRK